MIEVYDLVILGLFRVSGFFQKLPSGTWTAARRHMCLNPVFWVSLWTAWRLRVNHQATYAVLPSFPSLFGLLVVLWCLNWISIVCIRLTWQIMFCNYLFGGICMNSWMSLGI